MRIKHLHLENIGPFLEADLDFIPDTLGENEKPPVVLITGENGTGKSIILDAIRGMFGEWFCKLDRDLRRKGSETQAKIVCSLALVGQNIDLTTQQINAEKFQVQQSNRNIIPVLHLLPHQVQQDQLPPNWIVDYWPSVLAAGSYKITNLQAPNHKLLYSNALGSSKNKADITQLICHWDYLRSSEDTQEAKTGKKLYEILGKIITASLLEGGRFSHVARSTYEPVVIQNNLPVNLSQLSSGNSYMIQDLVHLLGKMYSLHHLLQTPLNEMCNAPGILFIDEAESQLHPKWQKRLIRTILTFFPNLQIIATTHSPFIIASVENARLFVCKAKGDHCIVEDETAEYANKPVDEILLSPLFEGTQPFNEKITTLIEARKKAVEAGDNLKRTKIEQELQQLNPSYFSYFDLDRLLAEATNGKIPA